MSSCGHNICRQTCGFLRRASDDDDDDGDDVVDVDEDDDEDDDDEEDGEDGEEEVGLSYLDKDNLEVSLTPVSPDPRRGDAGARLYAATLGVFFLFFQC